MSLPSPRYLNLNLPPSRLTIRTTKDSSPSATRITLGRDRASRGRRKGTTYSPEQEATAHRCRANGLTKAATAKVANLTEQQVHYLWYIKERQQQQTAHGQAQRAKTRPTLAQLVPDPITEGHTNTLPDHKYHGRATKFRTPLIDQVRKCKGHGYHPDEVAEYFKITAANVRYFWYHIKK